MKSYEDWSRRGKELGWTKEQYSEQAYKGYQDKFKPGGSMHSGSSAQKPPSKPSQPTAPPPSPAPAPSPKPNQNQANIQMQQQIEALNQQLADKNTSPAPPPAATPAPAAPKKESTKTVLTQGWNDWKKKQEQNWLKMLGKV